ncbi:hypothetical protein B0J11DRAFT_546273 [Dendryphion nanum]|uniref:Uncharacterized protein n=1 Tax=Dendryphion nanum TaxID=256645 RepID=A0A9P9J1A9_9PLEO|nr:hypothetical protein B0J11DRAFT_546273 [Dendryphion nanum]
MNSWLGRRKSDAEPQPSKPPDANAPLRRLQLQQECLYERTLPGEVYISAHVNRLQHGYYDSNKLHVPTLQDVYFVSVHFVFHAQRHRSHRIRSATIQVSVHSHPDPTTSPLPHRHRHPPPHPRILRHAPELMYGAISPENLQWNFSLSSSLGVTHVPIGATVNPSGSIQSNYKVYDMMSIQGSLRSLPHPNSPTLSFPDALAVWTLEENYLQRSGLPREFDFVLLVHKPRGVKSVFLSVDVDADVDTWFGLHPKWYQNLAQFLPVLDRSICFDRDIGQRFLGGSEDGGGSGRGHGFNFAELPGALEDYVAVPGSMYPVDDLIDKESGRETKRPIDHNQPSRDQTVLSPSLDQQQHWLNSSMEPYSERYIPASRRHGGAPEPMYVRVTVENPLPQHQYSRSGGGRQGSMPPQYVRRKRSRSRLTEQYIRQGEGKGEGG